MTDSTTNPEPPAEQATGDGARAIEAILDANCLREIRQLVDGGDVDPRGVVFSIRTSLAARYRWTGPAALPAEQAKDSANPPQPPAPDSPDDDYDPDFELIPETQPLTLADVDRRIAELARAAGDLAGIDHFASRRALERLQEAAEAGKS